MDHIGNSKREDWRITGNTLGRALIGLGLAGVAFFGTSLAVNAIDNTVEAGHFRLAEPEHGSLDPLEPTNVITDENGSTYVFGPLDNDQCPPLENSNGELYYFTINTEDGVESWWATDSSGQERINCES